MAEPTSGSGRSPSPLREFSSAMAGFHVVDRNGEEIGSVREVSLGRTCIVVETGRSRFGRKPGHAVHMAAVRDIDLDTFTISLAASKEDVADAPEFRDLEPDCETTLARYYHDRLAAHGDAEEPR